MSRINPLTSAKLNGGRLIALRMLTQKLGLSPRTVYGWARRGGVQGHRLPTITLAGWRHTTVQAFNQFVADVNGWSRPTEEGPRLGFRLGILLFADDEIPRDSQCAASSHDAVSSCCRPKKLLPLE